MWHMEWVVSVTHFEPKAQIFPQAPAAVSCLWRGVDVTLFSWHNATNWGDSSAVSVTVDTSCVPLEFTLTESEEK